MTEKTGETDTPIADGLDSWWRTAANSADAADREKRAIEAEDFQAHRAFRYVMSEGREQHGGWAALMGGRLDWRRM
jgi:hypothetical protein